MEGCFQKCVSLIYDLFYSMEDVGVIDPASEIVIWCLHYCFQDLISYRLKN